MNKYQQLQKLSNDLKELSKKQDKLHRYWESHPVKTKKANYKRFHKELEIVQQIIGLTIKFHIILTDPQHEFPVGGYETREASNE